jgi:hypothetical protein
MLTAKQSQSSRPVRSSKSSGLRVTSRPLPPQWRNRSPNPKKTLPLLLRVLLFLHQTSSLVAVGAIALSLILYGVQFRMQQVWNQKHEELQSLQRHEQTVTSFNEALKEEIAQSASRHNQNWVPLTPDRNIYLEPAEVPHSEETPSDDMSSTPTTLKIDRPIAY